MEIVEVGPRDGLQSEERVLATPDKLELIHRLAACGLRRIEVASFVHPKLVPQLADAEDVLAGLRYDSGTSYTGLVLNQRGLDRALATDVHEVNFVVAASEGYSRHNANASVADAIAGVEAMLPAAATAGKRTTVTISVAWGDPFDGLVDPQAVAALAGRAAVAGADEIALGDTVGAAAPDDVGSLVGAVRAAAPGVAIRCHFHNTRNTGYANAVAAAQLGVEALDSAIGGYGGSPFAPTAGGNVATEDLAHMLRLGDGISIPGLLAITPWLEERLGSPAQAMLGRSGVFPP